MRVKTRAYLQAPVNTDTRRIHTPVIMQWPYIVLQISTIDSTYVFTPVFILHNSVPSCYRGNVVCHWFNKPLSIYLVKFAFLKAGSCTPVKQLSIHQREWHCIA